MNYALFRTILLLSAAAAATSCVQVSDSGTDGGDLHSTHSVNLAAGSGDDIDGTVSLTVTTESLGGEFSPKNITALWVEDSDGLFVKTLGAWAATRKKYLYSWKTSQGSTDGTTGATRSGHGTPLSVTWDGTDDEGAAMKADTYRLRGELTDRNGAGETFSATIDLSGGAVAESTVSDHPGFAAVVSEYTIP